jgi:uncharacterized membrane protein
MSIFDKGLITILICSVVFSLASIPLILRRVPRNPVYGYRTRVTLSDDALWYKINAYFGMRFLVATLLSACVAVALHGWQGLSPQAYLKVSVSLLVAPVVVAWILTVRFVHAIGVEVQTSKADRRDLLGGADLPNKTNSADVKSRAAD